VKKKKISTPSVKGIVRAQPTTTRFIIYPPKEVDAQNTLAKEMCEWVLTDNAWWLDDFAISKRMAPSKVYKIAETNEVFEQAINFCRAVIASKMVHGWKNKIVEKEFCLRLLPLYSDEYKDYCNQKIFNDAKGRSTGTIITQLMQIPATPEVDQQLKKKEING
jgi:hypothetical protein